MQRSTFCEYCAMRVPYQAVSKVRERSPSSTLLQLLAHNPRLTAEWFVGSSNGVRYRTLETSSQLAGRASRRMQARRVHLWRIDCGCHPDNYPKESGEIITWPAQKHVYIETHIRVTPSIRRDRKAGRIACMALLSLNHSTIIWKAGSCNVVDVQSACNSGKDGETREILPPRPNAFEMKPTD